MSVCIFIAFAVSALPKSFDHLNLPNSKLFQEGHPEIEDSTFDSAYSTFLKPLDPNSQIIISMRHQSLEAQLQHLVYGISLAYALNRSLIVEVRDYPLSKTQPKQRFNVSYVNL